MKQNEKKVGFVLQRMFWIGIKIPNNEQEKQTFPLCQCKYTSDCYGRQIAPSTIMCLNLLSGAE